MPLEKLSWIWPTLGCHWRNSNFCSLHWNTTGWTVTAHTCPDTYSLARRIASMPVWNDRMAGHQQASAQVSVYSTCAWSLLPCIGCQLCCYHMWVLQHSSVHAFDMSTIIVFVYLGLQVKWNQLSSNNSQHTSCIHKGSHAEKWPDLMTSKPDSVGTLGYH